MQTINRYQRQMQLTQVGERGQLRLAAAEVLIVGCGGLGNVVAPLLAGAGVGVIRVLDFDQIEASNLHRQTVFTEAQIGKPKAACLAAHLRRLNSHIEVEAIIDRCHPDNVDALVKQADVVVDAADSFVVTYLLSEACEAAGQLLISASVNQTYGYVGSFCFEALPSYQAVFPYVPTQSGSCDELGVLGPSVAMIGGAQAQQALKFICTGEVELALFQFDLWDYAVHQIDVSGLAVKPAEIKFITTSSLRDQDTLIDVREPKEAAKQPFRHPHLINATLEELKADQITSLKHASHLVFACKSGQRALQAAQWWYSQHAIACKVLTPD